MVIGVIYAGKETRFSETQFLWRTFDGSEGFQLPWRINSGLCWARARIESLEYPAVLGSNLLPCLGEFQRRCLVFQPG